MCGIAGIAAFGGSPVPERADLVQMVTAIRHRGPDGFGYFIGDGIGLAHARLSIIDLTTGDQPVYNEDKSVCVVFNGEIFNYVELRAALIRQGHVFSTASDTEVIVHLYEEYGEEFVDHLNGQFAIALWDSKPRRLVLARDRTGIRPLFYTRQRGRVAFASEVKALHVLPWVDRGLDAEVLAQIFCYWAPLAGRSVFRGVEALEPGTVLILQDGRITTRRYWDWNFPEGRIIGTRSADDYADELRELLISAVRLQLRSDVPVGAYLSGGLDSSIITSIIKNFTDVPLRTFSLTFADAEFDESRHQVELVDYLRTNHTQIRCSSVDIGRAFPDTVWHTECPVVRTAPTPMMLLSGHVRAAGYKVVLTGEGADEVFGGYDIFKEAKVRRFMARQPRSRWRASILGRLYPYLEHSPAASPEFARRFFAEGIEHVSEPYFAHVPRWTTTQRIGRFFSEDMLSATAGWNPYDALTATLPNRIMHWSPMARDQYIEAHTLMSGYLLSSQGDRVGMANSIEGRFPFLDHRVIEFANALPPRYKLMGLAEKYLLRRSMRAHLPPSIGSRTKQPYRSPDAASFFVSGKPLDYVEDLLSETRVRAAGYFNPGSVRRLFEKARAGRAIGFGDNMAFVGILSTMLLHHQFILARPGAAA